MALFEKKTCDICGKQIGMMSNRKLEDGNMCKDCAAKLSPWFSGRKRTSVKEIKEQLTYREANALALKNFDPDIIIGKRYKVYIDTKKRQFAVTAASKWREANPDLIAFSDVRDISCDIKEDSEEIYDKDEEGKKVSYDPPRYRYEYTFRIGISVSNPYFDSMNFELTAKRPESVRSREYEEYVQMVKDIYRIIVNKDFVDDTSGTTVTAEWYCPQCGTKNSDNFCTRCGHHRPAMESERYCPKCGNKITDLTSEYCPKCGSKLA